MTWAVNAMVQAVLDTLGSNFDGIVDANLLPWAQLAWGAGVGVGGPQADTAVAASLVQRLDWQEMAFTLPGQLILFCGIASYYRCLCMFCKMGHSSLSLMCWYVTQGAKGKRAYL